MATEPRRFTKGIVFKSISSGPSASDTDPTCNIPGHTWLIDTQTTQSTIVSTCCIAICTETFTKAAHGLSNNQHIKITCVSCTAPTTSPAGLLDACDKAFVICSTTCTFKLSATRGGSAIDITCAGAGCLTFTVIEEQFKAYLCSGTEKLATDSNKITFTCKTHTDPILNGNISGDAFLDEDCMCSNSATKVSSQQAVKAYVDAQVTAQDLDFAGDAGTGCVDLDSQCFTVAGSCGICTTAACQTLTISACHDAIPGFVADEHIAHSCVCITAGDGLSGGGNISATRTLDVCITSECAKACPVSADELLIADSADCNNIKKITIGSFSGSVAHDCTCGFVADEHVAHSCVCITAGDGLSGGGNISASRTIDICITCATDKVTPVGADEILLADSACAGAIRKADIASISCSIAHDCTSGFVADEHVAHSCVCITAGSGLTGGGNIAASRTINVGSGTGICVGACTVSIDCTVTTLTGCQTLTNKTLTSPTIGTNSTYSNQAEVRFAEQTGNGCNYVGFEAPDAVTCNQIWKLPDGDGCSGQVLSTDGCGNLSWVAAPSLAPPIAFSTNAADCIANLTTTFIDFEDLELDGNCDVLGAGTGNTCVSGCGWRYIAPSTGWYHVHAQLAFDNAEFDLGEAGQMLIYVNGILVKRSRWDGDVSTATVVAKTFQISGLVNVTSGQRIEIAFVHAAGVTITPVASGLENYVHIWRQF